MDALIAVLRALVDAAFSAGVISEPAQRDLNAKLDEAAAPPLPEPAPDPAPEVPPAVAASVAPPFGSESQHYA